MVEGAELSARKIWCSDASFWVAWVRLATGVRVWPMKPPTPELPGDPQGWLEWAGWAVEARPGRLLRDLPRLEPFHSHPRPPTINRSRPRLCAQRACSGKRRRPPGSSTRSFRSGARPPAPAHSPPARAPAAHTASRPSFFGTHAQKQTPQQQGCTRAQVRDWRGGRGWLPEVALNEGLASTVDWYREHSEWWGPLRSDLQGTV